MTNANESTRKTAIDATIETTPNAEAVLLSFSNGKQLRLRIADLTNELHVQAVLHGLKQKLVDAAAISRDPETGKSASVDVKYAAAKEVYDRLLSGQWNKTREGGAVKGGLLFRALTMLYPDKTADQLKAYLDKRTAAEKTALRETPKIAEIILQLKADHPADSDVDTDALLGELDD